MIETFISSQEVPLLALTDHGVVWVPAQDLALIPQHPAAIILVLWRLQVLGQGEMGQLGREDSR